jgi:Family of unknown function (DUF6335)
MARKAAGKAKGRRNTPSKRKTGAGSRAAARSGARARRASKAARTTGRKTAGARTPSAKARRKTATTRAGKQKTTRSAKTRTTRPRGGTGREETLAQTLDTGRSVRGLTNPMPTKRSTGTAAGAGTTRRAPGLERERKQLREIEESVQGPPSSLNMDRHGSAARTGRANLRHAKHEHTETSPAMTGGDVDADWEDAYAVGDEAPGGDNPTPDQDVVDDIGRALGIEYQDNEELKGSDKIAERDKRRWELDPASAEDYKDRG